MDQKQASLEELQASAAAAAAAVGAGVRSGGGDGSGGVVERGEEGIKDGVKVRDAEVGRLEGEVQELIGKLGLAEAEVEEMREVLLMGKEELTSAKEEVSVIAMVCVCLRV